jgi:hypothetical protein
MTDLRKAAQDAGFNTEFDDYVIDHWKRFEKFAELVAAALAIPEPIPGATPMAEYAAKSAAVPGRAEALKQAGYSRRPRQLPQEDEQEPVAWWDGKESVVFMHDEIYTPNWTDYWTRPLYTHPPQRKPLTDEEIEYLAPASFTWREFARNIEHEHGIL